MKDLKNRNTFSKWVYLLHETVNTMLNKKSKLSYEDVRDRYEHFRSRCAKKTKKTKKTKKEKGCTTPLKGKKKSKCIMKIVPFDKKETTFQIDKKCKL